MKGRRLRKNSLNMFHSCRFSTFTKAITLCVDVSCVCIVKRTENSNNNEYLNSCRFSLFMGFLFLFFFFIFPPRHHVLLNGKMLRWWRMFSIVWNGSNSIFTWRGPSFLGSIRKSRYSKIGFMSNVFSLAKLIPHTKSIQC